MNPTLIVSIIVLGLLIAAEIGGYAMGRWHANTACQAEMADRERAAVLRVVQEHERLQRIDDEIEQAWITTQQRIDDRHAQAKPKLAATFTTPQRTDGACNLTRGTVGLLNDTARGDEAGTEAAGLPPGQAQAPSDVTEQAALEHCRLWAEQYDRVAGQLTQLIDWTERSAHVAGQE